MGGEGEGERGGAGSEDPCGETEAAAAAAQPQQREAVAETGVGGRRGGVPLYHSVIGADTRPLPPASCQSRRAGPWEEPGPRSDSTEPPPGRFPAPRPAAEVGCARPALAARPWRLLPASRRVRSLGFRTNRTPLGSVRATAASPSTPASGAALVQGGPVVVGLARHVAQHDAVANAVPRQPPLPWALPQPAVCRCLPDHSADHRH